MLTLSRLRSGMQLPAPTDEIEQKVVDPITRNELQASEHGPSFSYSIGFGHLLAHPELLIAQLPFENAQNILYTAFDRVREGSSFNHLDRAFRVVSPNLEACFLQLLPAARDQYLTLASWANNRESFNALQCVWPDRAGLFPWDTEYDSEFHQSIIGEIGQLTDAG